MNSTLKVIFDELACKPLKDNPFETKGTGKKLSDFLRTRFIYKDNKHFDEIFCSLIDITSEIQEQAFTVGFYTAIDLLMK